MDDVTAYIGPMYSGKTTKLVSAIFNLLNCGCSVQVIEHPLNTRNCSRDIKNLLHGTAPHPKNLLVHDQPSLDDEYFDWDAVVFDEVHLYDVFVGDPAQPFIFQQIFDRARHSGASVFLGGIYFNGHNDCRPFPLWETVLPYCDHVEFLRSRRPCTMCGDDGSVIYSVASYPNKTEKVGDDYIHLCRTCFVARKGSI